MYRITDECIACTLCEPVCPVGAIVNADPIPYAVTNACDGCKSSSSPMCLEVCPIDCIVLDYTEQEMLEGLTHEDPSVRVVFARVSSRIKLSARLVESRLTDPDNDVRAAFAARTDITPVAFQIERGLTDSAAGVRLSFASRRDVLMSPVQIERGLTDESDGVRAAVSSRREFVPSAEQIERGLTDPCISVRCNFIERPDCDLTDAQFERAKADKSAGVQMRLHHKRRVNLEQTPSNKVSQIAAARKKKDPPSRHDGELVLKALSLKLCNELKAANSRLKQHLTPRSVLFGLKLAAQNESFVLLQPGHSGYAWSDRTIPVVFIAHVDGEMRVRVTRSNSYRNSKVTPAIWPELRGFPGKDVELKIAIWASAPDGDAFPMNVVADLPGGETDCSVSEW
jgi:NAD-dependent dihydropyrimidine dehydrogenase PreA subunit